MRDELETPRSRRRQVRAVEFFHPAFPVNTQPLLRLPAVEGETDDEAGLAYDVALLACGIVTGNTWGVGYLATKEQGADDFVRIERPADGMLHGAVYFYLLDGHTSDYEYGVVISFDHWRFPHDNLPAVFEQTEIETHPDVFSHGKTAALARDSSCRMTGHQNSVEGAHIVPEAEMQWFIDNRMDRYSPQPSDSKVTGGAVNIISLRHDIHFLWDQSRLTFIPRFRARNKPRIELYVFNPVADAQLVTLYHNRPTKLLSGISKEYLLARFAFIIFLPRFMRYFGGFIDRVAVFYDPHTGKSEEAKLMNAQVRTRARLFYRPAKSRSSSVTKRKYNADAEQDDCGDSCESDSSYDSGDESPPRGRKRRRSSYEPVISSVY